MVKNHYYIIKLNVRILIRIHKESRRAQVGSVTYIEITWPASLLLKFLKRLGVPLKKVQPRSSAAGPVLHLSNVRNEKGEVVALDFYHEVLAIRKKISEQLKRTFAGYWFFKNGAPEEMILSCIGLRVAQDITPAVCLGYYARWRKIENEPAGERRNILVVQGADWSETLAGDLADKIDTVVVTGRAGRTLGRLFQVIKNTLQAVGHLVYLCLFKRPGKARRAHTNPPRQEKPGKIMINYRMGVTREKRNDISYVHSSELGPGRLLIMVRSKSYIPSPEEMEWMRSKGATCLSSYEIEDPGLQIPRWKPTRLYSALLSDFYREYLKTLAHCMKTREKNSLWMLEKSWEIEKTKIYWRDLFQENGVKILVNSTPSDQNFDLNVAMAQAGGIAVEFERSIRFDYCTYIHNAPNHVYFATGPYSFTQTPEPSFSLYTVETGGINLVEDPNPLEEIEKIRKNSEIVITVFDEYPNDIFFGESVHEMYRIVLEVVKADPRFALLLKTKKPQIIENMEDVYEEILRLSREGRCLEADWRVSPSTAVKHGNLVVSVISTAAFESVLLGAKLFIYNPMRSGSKIFYSNNGLDRRIFEDSQTMIQALLRYAEGKDETLGDCRDILSQIDPFGDGRGAERMGQYLQRCLEGFDRGLEWNAVLENANETYTQKWGKDKITAASGSQPHGVGSLRRPYGPSGEPLNCGSRIPNHLLTGQPPAKVFN